MSTKNNPTSRFESFTKTFSDLLSSSQHQQAIISSLLHECLRQNASDINIEPAGENACDIFFRIDGILLKVMTAIGKQAAMIRGAVLSNSQRQQLGKFDVNEGIIRLQEGEKEFLFEVYNIPQAHENSLLIKIPSSPPRQSTPTNYTAKDQVIPQNIAKKIFIWQMGKVGSSSVYSSLLPHSQPCQWHVPPIRDNNKWPIHNNIIQTHEINLLYDFLHYSNEEFVIISLVRDLLERNISAIFQSMNYEESWRNQYFIATEADFKKISYEQQEQEVTRHLQKLNTSTAVTSWYDNLLKSHIYYPEIDKYFIDIYGKPFDQEKGFQIYESKSSRVKMIIIRLEDLNCREKELGDFLGIDKFRLISKNRAKEKWYQPIYTRFKKRYKPAPEEIEAIYSSQFMRYFYSPDQIRALTTKWDKPCHHPIRSKEKPIEP